MSVASSRNIAVIGLGYVGLPVAASFAKKKPVIGFDINEKRVKQLKDGIDVTGEVSAELLKSENLIFSSNVEDMRKANFYIIAVPTPIDSANKPNLNALIGASRSVGKVLKKGDVVVFESTVFPGATEEECLPVLEKESGLKLGEFKIGYSPERINPGDKEHTFTKITKVVSGSDNEALEIIASEYGSVVEAGVYKASSIKVAEAAKVIENTQRDLNIALMNELALIFHRMGIDTNEVIEAAGTKWNFLKFRPGLVGGHCIGVDPYYLTYQAEKFGYIPQVILSGRRVNDNVGKYIAEKAIKEMVKCGIDVSKARATVLGVTFKENCPDIRNSKVFDIIEELKDYGVELQIHDPIAEKDELNQHHGIEAVSYANLEPADVVIIAVAHKEFVDLSKDDFKKLMKPNSVLIDVKSIYPKNHLGMKTWRL